MRFDLPQPVKKVMDALEKAGWAAYAVGGCVRDRVLGVPPHDYDVCTAAPPGETQRVFRGERTIETGLKHGTLTVLMDGMPIEITTFRQDGEYRDGRHPDLVRFTPNVEDDLARRDFTINAMAYSPTRGLVDPYGGREDCQRGVIRCVGEPEKRFGEDALRILRALRFSARLGFPIEENTAAALHRGKAGLGRISRERIAAELNGLLCAPHAGEVLREYGDVVREALDPGAPADRDAWLLAVRRLEAAPTDPGVRWAALLMEEGAGRAADLLKGLKMPSRTIDTVEQLVFWSAPEYAGTPALEWLMRLGEERARQELLLRRADRIARKPEEREQAQQQAGDMLSKIQRLTAEGACFTLRQLAVRGPDLARLGYAGPEIGKQLNELLLMVVRGVLPNEKEALLAAAQKKRA